MPFITVMLWKGRTKEQKEEMAQGIAQVVSRVASTHLEGVTVVFMDIDKSDWAIGGELASNMPDHS